MDDRNSCTILPMLASGPRRFLCLRCPAEKTNMANANANANANYREWRNCYGDMVWLISLLDVLPSWPGSSSSKNRTWPPPLPPSDDINIDDMRSFIWRGSESLDDSISSVTLVLRLCRLEFGGNSSMKPLAHNGHVYSYKLCKWKIFISEYARILWSAIQVHQQIIVIQFSRYKKRLPLKLARFQHCICGKKISPMAV